MVMALGLCVKWPLGVVYTMDYEVVLGPCKSIDWLLNLSRDHFGLHQRKNVGVTMKVEVPPKHIFRLIISTNMVQWVLWKER